VVNPLNGGKLATLPLISIF